MYEEKKETYLIINIEKYSEYARQEASSVFTEKEEKLDDYITIPQVISLIKEIAIDQNEKKQYIIDEEGNEKLIEKIIKRIYNSGLSKMAAQDKIECAWDNKKNKMIFWNKK